MSITTEKIKQVMTMPDSGRGTISNILGVSDNEAKILVAIRDHSSSIMEAMDMEVVKYTQKLASQKQKSQDVRRIENKTWKQNIRLFTAIEEQTEALSNLLKTEGFKIKTNEYPSNKKKPVGVVQLSDLHANELVSLPDNKYDFIVMSKRIEKHIKKSTAYFKSNGVTDVVVCLTGDCLNSDRRLDEVTAMATNRTSAQFLCAEVLINAIVDLNKHFNITCSYVDGNESRVGKDIGWNDIIASDTYDTSIYCIIRRVLQDKKGISFDSRLGTKKVLNINGQNVLQIHGHQNGFGSDPLKAVTKIIAQYAAQGVIIRMVILGHIHMAFVSETFARSGSPVGANAYSQDGLNLTSRASQNCYLVFKDGSIDGMMIDLQEYKGYKGYPIQKELAAYNTKSADKCKGVTVFDAVIDKLH